MSDFKKIQPVTEAMTPKFPTSRKSGYVEDAVDTWLTTHFSDLQKTVAYQNACVDEIERLEAELVDQASALATVHELTNEVSTLADENHALDLQVKELTLSLQAAHTALNEVQVVDAEAGESYDALDLVDHDVEAPEVAAQNAHLETRVVELEAQLSHAHSEMTELQSQLAEATAAANIVVQPGSNAAKATSILQAANDVAEAAIARANEEAANIVETSKAQIADLTSEILELEAEKTAAYTALRKFYSEELKNLDKHEVFNGVNKDDDAEESESLNS